MAASNVKPELFVHVWPTTDGFIEEVRFDYTISSDLHLWIMHKEYNNGPRIYFVIKGKELEISPTCWNDILHNLNPVRRLFLPTASTFASIHVEGFIISKNSMDTVCFTYTATTDTFTLSEDEFERLLVTNTNAEIFRREEFIRPHKL